MAAISDTHHVPPECDLRTGREVFCQMNGHKPRFIPLSVAAVVQIHALWCALSLPPRLRRCCHQSRPTAQLAADRAVEGPRGHPGSAHPQRISPCATGHGSVAATRPWAGASGGFDPDSIPKKEPEQPPRVTHRTSKQRNKHIQHVLVEAAKMAPRYSPELALVREREIQRGNKNRATLAVARKMVAYMLAVERRKQDFVPAEEMAGRAVA